MIDANDTPAEAYEDMVLLEALFLELASDEQVRTAYVAARHGDLSALTALARAGMGNDLPMIQQREAQAALELFDRIRRATN